MSKARGLANIVAEGSALADGVVALSEISGGTNDGVLYTTSEGVTHSGSNLTFDGDHLHVSGNVNATTFIGDGSELTGIDALPSQTDNDNKYLKTNGTVATWEELVIPEVPVDSVNGYTGVVSLSASDVGAATASDISTAVAGLASETYVNTAVSNLVDSSPATLDTLNELAAALGDDPNFATTVSTTIGTKADKTTLISAGTGLTGGGDLSANRTITHANSTVAPGNYGSSTSIPSITVDARGHVTAASNNSISVGNGAFTVNTGSGLTGGAQLGTANQAADTSVTISHADTSTQASVNNSNGTVIQDVTLDGFGHITGLASVDLDSRYAPVSHNHDVLYAVDDRDMKPNTSGIGTNVKAIRPFFSSLGGMTGAANSDYQDVLVLDTYTDASGGNANAITLDKSNGAMRVWNAPNTATSWGTAQRVFADNYHPNADKWTTARTNTVTLTGDVTGSGSASVDGSGNWTVSLSTAVGDADTVDGLHVHGGRNNEVNKIVRTDGSGYIQAGWINSTSGATTSTITRITASNDEYLRYVTPATFRTQITDPYYPTKTGGGASGTWPISITGNAAYATTAGSADQIDGWGFVNTGSNNAVNADTITSNGISYYTGGVTNFSGNATDGALYSQIFNASWQHQIAGDYRSGQIAVRGRNSGTWQGWRTVVDSSNVSSYAALPGHTHSNYVTTTYNSSLNSDSRNSRGVTRLYRRDDNSDFSVQTYWTGSYWRLYGYNGDSAHADVQVGYADNAGYASSAGNADTLDGLDSTAYLRDNGWNTYPGQDANSQPTMSDDFTYSNNAPHTGDLIKFGASNYSLQLNSQYNGTGQGFSFRTRNGDSGAWNPWYHLVHAGNVSSYAAAPGNYLPLAGGNMSGNIGRTSHSSGYLVGGHNNIGDTSIKTNPIYAIGSGYQPNDNDLVNMYGIGYSHPNAAYDGINTVLSGWGLYVAAGGTARVGLDGDTGRVKATGAMYAPIYYDLNDTSYYCDPNGTTVLNALTVNSINANSHSHDSISHLGRISAETGRNTYRSGVYTFGTYTTANPGGNPPLSYPEIISWGAGATGSIQLAGDWISTTSTPLRVRSLRDCCQDWSSWSAIATSNESFTNNIDLRAPIFYDSNDTNYYVDPASTTTSVQVAGAIEQGHNYAHPNIEWAASGNSTGEVIFYLPGNINNYGMVHMVFDIYEYASPRTATVIIGGHNWSNSWYNTACNVVGYTDKTVRLGVKDSRFCVIFGGTTSGWSYGQIRLRKIQNGSYYNNIMNLGGDWAVTQTTSESFTSITGDLRNLRTPANLEVDNISYAYGSSRAPIFYDYNDTGYYTDPNSTSDTAQRMRGGTVYGPNVTWGSYLLVGGDGRQNYTNSGYASVCTTNGNLHLDSGTNNATHINWYDGTDLLVGAGDSSTLRFQVYGTGNYSYASGSMRSPIFYDADDTAYYVDPNGTSRLNSTVTTQSYTHNWFRNYASGTGLYNESTGQHFYSDDDDYWNIAGGSGANGLRFRDEHGGTIRGYVYADYSNNIGFLDLNGSWKARVVNGDYFLIEGSSIRAVKFFDSNNTGYFVNPTASTNLSDLYVNELHQNLATGDTARLTAAIAWVNFNGTGVVAIRASSNVTSITDVGTGTYTVNFAITMPNTNYSVQLTASNYNGGQANTPSVQYGSGSYWGNTSPTTKTTTAIRFVNGIGNSASVIDSPELNVAIFDYMV